MTPYPDSLPLEEIKTIVNIIRAKEAVEKKAELAYSGWIVIGYALNKALGDPNFSLSAQAVGDGFVELEKLADGEINAQGLIPWTLILKYLVSMLLDEILK